MSLFGGNNPLSTEEDVKVNLAQLAGGTAGVGIGMMAGVPLNIRYQDKAVEQAQKIFQDRQGSKKHWETLLQIVKGELSLDDLPQERRRFYEKKLRENAEDLQYMKSKPYEARKALQALDRTGDVRQFPQKNRGSLRNIFPQLGEADPQKLKLISPNANTKIQVHKVRHPASKLLPGALGIIGGIAGGEALKRRYLQENEE